MRGACMSARRALTKVCVSAQPPNAQISARHDVVAALVADGELRERLRDSQLRGACRPPPFAPPHNCMSTMLRASLVHCTWFVVLDWICVSMPWWGWAGSWVLGVLSGLGAGFSP
jgi:hypothetical protein